MNTSVQIRNTSNSTVFRWAGRAAGIVLFVIWATLVISDVPRLDPHWGTYLQGAVLAAVFAGYLAGWWHELVGGVMTIAGTVVYFAVCVLTTQRLPGPEVVLFAAPGICYLLARYFARIEKFGASHET